MRITKRTNIAIRLLMFCGVNSGRLVTKAEAAECCNVSENHLAQILYRLSRSGYLDTQRGRKGGFMLARDMKDIQISEIFHAFDEPEVANECLADSDNSCPLSDVCRLRTVLDEAVAAFYGRLETVTLDTLVCGNSGLFDLMLPIQCETASAGLARV